MQVNNFRARNSKTVATYRAQTNRLGVLYRLISGRQNVIWAEERANVGERIGDCENLLPVDLVPGAKFGVRSSKTAATYSAHIHTQIQSVSVLYGR